MTKKQDKMMICPKAKECKKHGDFCLASDPHEENSNCHANKFCPACIPYEPQPTTCPDCKGTGERTIPSYYPIKEKRPTCTPADLQSKHCTGCLNPSDNYNCVSKEDCPEQPTPTMPLAKCAKGFTIRCSICEEIKPDDDGRCVYLQTQQAHDSDIAAQARKRTLKYVEATLERAFVNLSPIEQGVLNICLVHIRAMAEKEG